MHKGRHASFNSIRALEYLLQVKSHMRKGNSLMFVKTIVNSWSTPYRYHESVRLPCIFGCEGCHDTLMHYLRCDILRTTSCTALGLDIGWLNLVFPQRFGHPIPNITHINLNAVMFKTSHSEEIIQSYDQLVYC